MGAINYFTSDYITMGIKPYSVEMNDFDREYAYSADFENINDILSSYDFYYFHVKIKPGYYEGFTLDIENNFSIAFDGWEDKQDAQREITSLKKCLLKCAGAGMVQCSPGWIPAYNDYKGTCKAIGNAIKIMREELKNTPTWAQYARENARKAG